MKARKHKTMNAGKSLRMLMSKHNVSCAKLSLALKVSATTMGLLRKKKLMSGKNVVAMSDYFGISCSDFIAVGEE